MTESNLKQLADLHDENIKLKKYIERLNQHYNIDKVEKAAENYAKNWFDMYDTNHYKALKQGFEAGSKWQINQISPAINACESEIKKLKAEREWISVEDRLPENRDDVLALNTQGYISMGFFWELDNRTLFHSSGNIDSKHITHWMPLPELPKQ